MMNHTAMTQKATAQSFTQEVQAGARFEFGTNWTRFLKVLDQEKLNTALHSLQERLGVSNLEEKRFLDVGSGSGLFSLAARQLGASVHSFDYDSQSVACTRELRRRYYSQDQSWTVEQGSVLDQGYVTSLGKFDVVYSWGVLHHTGAMWRAFDNVSQLVAENGKLFISIYNDQGLISRYWRLIKRLYNSSRLFRPMLIALHFPYLFLLRFLVRLVTGRLKVERGMHLYYDMLDWLGGYPFEVATLGQVEGFFTQKGFNVIFRKDCGRRHGCNEFVFVCPAARERSLDAHPKSSS